MSASEEGPSKIEEELAARGRKQRGLTKSREV